jgi:hypothetical protein
VKVTKHPVRKIKDLPSKFTSVARIVRLFSQLAAPDCLCDALWQQRSALVTRDRVFNLAMHLLFILFVSVAAQNSIYLCGDNFSSSAFTPGAGFFGVAPLPDKSGYNVSDELAHGGPEIGYNVLAADDPWLTRTLPMWTVPTSAKRTAPFMTGFSSVRVLGGLSIHNKTDGTYEPLPEYDAVFRDPNNSTRLRHNFTRVDATFDGILGAGITEILVVLDNVPYAFVAPQNRYYATYGLSSAPDDADEYADFIGIFVEHLVERYSEAVVSKWRFRLGTEADGPRYGPPWLNQTYHASRANGSTFAIAPWVGLLQYMATYKAVGMKIKQKLTTASFGPSNMLSCQQDGEQLAGMGKNNISNGRYSPGLIQFGEYIRAQKLPIDFAAASNYARGTPPLWPSGLSYSPAQLMKGAVEELKVFAGNIYRG